MKTKKPYRRVTEEDIRVVKALSDSGITINAAAKVLKKSPATVKLIKDGGYTLEGYHEVSQARNKKYRPVRKTKFPGKQVSDLPQPLISCLERIDSQVASIAESTRQTVENTQEIATTLERLVDIMAAVSGSQVKIDH